MTEKALWKVSGFLVEMVLTQELGLVGDIEIQTMDGFRERSP